MSRKNKFDLTSLVHKGYLKENERLSFVSDSSKFCRVWKMPNNEFKVKVTSGETEKIETVHAFVQECLGMEAPDHASKWLKSESGKTLYELWHVDDSEAA